MAYPFRQTSFSGGYLSPQLYGRTDVAKYQAGLAECTNAWITRYGTLENRSGFQFCGEVRDSTQPLRLVPFVFSDSKAYVLEVGNDYFRPWMNGARVACGAGGTPVNPWSNTTTYDQGDFVTYLGGTYRSLQANNLNHAPDLAITYWQLEAGALVDVLTAIPQASLPHLNYVQRTDIMTLVDQGITPQQFLRFSDSKWQQRAFVPYAGISPPSAIAVVAGAPAGSIIANPTSLAATGGNAALAQDAYVVTASAVSFTGQYQESGVSDAALSTVGGADAGNPVALTWTGTFPASGYFNRTYHIYKFDRTSGKYGLIGSNGPSNPPSATFTDSGISPDTTKPPPTTGQNVFTFRYVVTSISDANGAESLPSSSVSCTGQTPSITSPNVVSWTGISGATKYNVYRGVNGTYCFVGSASGVGGLTFSDTNIIPDESIQPPVAMSLFSTSNDYPAVVGYYQQRLGFANTVNEPQTVNFSRVGNDTNFNTSTPIADIDAVSFTVAGKQVQEVRSLVDLGKLIVHTNHGEYVCTGNAAGALTPTASGLLGQSASGSDWVQPVVIGNTDLFVQQGATRVNDLRYEVQSFGYGGKDLTKFAPDLFQGRTVVDMAWQKLPHSILWCVLSDGSLVALTYTRDGAQDDVICWHTHASTNGAFENIAIIPEGSESAVYVVVRRVINGATKRYIERLASRTIVDTTWLSDSFFADSFQLYDGRNTGATTITVTTAGGWTANDTYTLTASAPLFAAADAPAGNPQGVGNTFIMRQVNSLGVDTARVYFTVTGYTSSTIVTATVSSAVPTWAQGVALTTWGKAVHSFTGADHLEGQSIAILGDGNVIASPNNPEGLYPAVTVTGGAFTLPNNVNCMVVCAGLPMTMEATGLPVENQKGDTIIGKQCALKEVVGTFYQSRGGYLAQKPPAGQATKFVPWKQRSSDAYALPTALFTGSQRVNAIQSNWGAKGQGGAQWVIQQPDPVPFGLSAVTGLVDVGN